MIFVDNDSYTYSIANGICYFKVKVDFLENTNNSFLRMLSNGLVHEKEKEKAIKSIVVDLANVMYVDASTLGIFITAVKVVKGLNIKLKFVNMQHNVLTVVEMTQLRYLFNVDEEETVAPWESK
jgi:anti-anti-sigma factor